MGNCFCTLSDWGQSGTGIDLGINQFRVEGSLSDWGQSDIGIDLGKSIQLG